MATKNKTIKVTRIGSTIGRPKSQELNLRGLGLTKTGRTVELEDTPAVRGMIKKVAHLVKVEE
ncbi:MAG: 50S ribosomal protein L30 [Alphaproteobacteria bacterium]|nr:50S ribosomal protein L30 [Alphaproteobacteria bacterium]MBR3502151.1 50S ribosomal protein L30 [Alphaproteobacteria bacterium]